MINIFCLTFFTKVLLLFVYNFTAAELYLSGKFFVDRLENFRSTVANKSELEVWLYFSPIEKLVQYFFHLRYSPDKVKIWRNSAQPVRNFFCAINIQFLQLVKVQLSGLSIKKIVRRASVLQLTTLKKTAAEVSDMAYGPLSLMSRFTLIFSGVMNSWIHL